MFGDSVDHRSHPFAAQVAQAAPPGRVDGDRRGRSGLPDDAAGERPVPRAVDGPAALGAPERPVRAQPVDAEVPGRAGISQVSTSTPGRVASATERHASDSAAIASSRMRKYAVVAEGQDAVVGALRQPELSGRDAKAEGGRVGELRVLGLAVARPRACWPLLSAKTCLPSSSRQRNSAWGMG